MSKWVIYQFDGSVRYDGVHDLTYNGTWMGECFLSVTVRSASPIGFSIGDYIIYRNEKFVLNNVPSVSKKSRSNTYGEGFCYDQMKFSSLSTELSYIKFRDIVLHDNLTHYSSLPRFSFYASDIDDFADRLQSNTNRWCANNGFPLSDYWKFITPDFQRSLRRGVTIDEYNESYGGSFYTDGEKFDVSLVVDNITIWESLSFIKDHFGLNFVTQGRRVVIAGAGIPTSDIFRYGKGNGLYEIERVADSDQQVVTKLFAYGSDKNMPVRYYANIGVVCWSKMYARPSMDSKSFAIDLPWSEFYFTSSPDSEGRYPVVFVHNGSSYRVKARGEGFGSRVLVMLDGDVPFDFIDSTDELLFVGGIDKDKWPKSNVRYTSSNLPSNMSVGCLMLPGFPNYSLSELCRCTYDFSNDKTLFEIRDGIDDLDEYHVFLELDGSHVVEFSDDKYDPYILSSNKDVIGIKEGDVYFTDSRDDNGLKEIYPSIEGLTYGDIDGTTSSERIDELYSAEMITDSGIFGEGDTTPPTFSITLKRLGFDLDQAFNNAGGQMSIVMKDGYCGGRDFKVKSVRSDGDLWICTCERHHDSLLNLYYPYSYNVSIGGSALPDEPYQLRGGDHYVITGIYIEDSSYIRAASIKLLRNSIIWLLSNDYTRYTYTPKVDEIFMAYQHERHAQGERSYHDTLKEGNVMQFEDTDLGIDGSIYIDTLRISEHSSNGIATYDITLRNDKQVGTFQRIQNQISSLSSYVNGGGGGMSISQIREVVSSYGKDHFISKLRDDVVTGVVSFVKGIVSRGKSLFESGFQVGSNFVSGLSNSGAHVDSSGNCEFESLLLRSFMSSPVFVEGFAGSGIRIWRDVLGSWNAEFDGLTVRGTMRVYELLIDKLKSVGGQILVSKANGRIKAVDDDDQFLYLTFEGDNEFVVDDLLRCQTFSGSSLKSYWVKVVGIDSGRVVVNKQDSGMYSGVPEVGDDIVLCGNESDVTRQALILISSCGDSSGEPTLSVLSGVSSRSFSSCLKTRLGYLGDIRDADLGQLSGYGLYGENVFLKGTFYLKNGSSYVKVDDSITAAVSNLEIGGRNFLLNSDFSSDVLLDHYGVNNSSVSVVHLSDDLPPGFSSGLSFSSDSPYSGIFATPSMQPSALPLSEGCRYTLSFWGRLNGAIVGEEDNFVFGYETSGCMSEVRLGFDWQRYSISFTASSVSSSTPIIFYAKQSGFYSLTGLKLERGDKATDWTPSTADLESRIDVLSDRVSISVTKGDLETAGVHIDGSNSKILLRASTTEVSDDLLVHRLKTLPSSNGVTSSVYDGILMSEHPSSGQKAVFGINEHGQLVLQFWRFDELICDLSPDGLMSKIDVCPQKWSDTDSLVYLPDDASTDTSMLIDTITPNGSTYHTYIAGFKTLSGVKKYLDPITGEATLDVPPPQNGISYSSESVSSSMIPDGWYRVENLVGSYNIDNKVNGVPIYFFEIMKFSSGRQVGFALVWFRTDTSPDLGKGRLTSKDGDPLRFFDYPTLYSYYDSI